MAAGPIAIARPRVGAPGQCGVRARRVLPVAYQLRLTSSFVRLSQSSRMFASNYYEQFNLSHYRSPVQSYAVARSRPEDLCHDVETQTSLPHGRLLEVAFVVNAVVIEVAYVEP